jgi:rare lipoprotein A
MKKSITLIAIGFVCLLFSLPASGQEKGIASYYHDALTGRQMANGDYYDPTVLTCAHLTLPFGTVVKIASVDNPEQSVMATVTDRGPYVKGRIIDLSRSAAEELGIIEEGITEVVVAVVTVGDNKYNHKD